jgi:hypothetical protein
VKILGVGQDTRFGLRVIYRTPEPTFLPPRLRVPSAGLRVIERTGLRVSSAGRHATCTA